MLPGAPAIAPGAGGRLHHVPGAVQVRVDDREPALDAEVDRRLRELAAAVVDHEHRAGRSARRWLASSASTCSGSRMVIAHVPILRSRCLLDAGRGLLELLLAPAADHDVGAESRAARRRSRGPIPEPPPETRKTLPGQQVGAEHDRMSRELLVGEAPVAGRASVGFESLGATVVSMFLVSMCSPKMATLATLRLGMPPRLCVSPSAGEPQLPLAGAAEQLQVDLVGHAQAGRADRVAEALQARRRSGRGSRRRGRSGRRARRARRAPGIGEPEILHQHQLGDREAVVHFHQVDLRRAARSMPASR